ncbi:hypothetical protein GCWU000342_01055 [Shuttleworthella satelles DSM 14600]|uniref:Uncharacterized protein n=1 Tax=Shuttleworthella satelles DSM 14600 TaxID=626523 RepID=C4GAV3_9FIRM|nr:hypothetical protein GCWU000342_01055 [Shuttleworthia satelles DSM 14600]
MSHFLIVALRVYIQAYKKNTCLIFRCSEKCYTMFAEDLVIHFTEFCPLALTRGLLLY